MSEPKKAMAIEIPQLSEGADVYDSIMKEIEPDLVSATVGKLDEMYANETEAQHALRMERYKKALATYKEKYEEYRTNQKSSLRSFGKNVVAEVERNSSEEEEGTMNDLESAILAA